MHIDYYLDHKRSIVDENLKKLLPEENTYPETIHRSMHYSVFAGGKRLRPILMLAVGEFLAGNEKLILPFASALEMIHTYSLIHDDLPALDNDNLRRGKPTNHVVFGEDIAILTGDALLNCAYETMTETCLYAKETIEKTRAVEATHELATAAGTKGMIGGQVVDVQMEQNTGVNLETVSYIHEHKTSALFTVSAKIGAILSGAKRADRENITNFASKLGLAFQIIDDVLDVQGEQADLGKSVGKDTAQGKATFPAFLGIDASKKRAHHLHNEALTALSGYGDKAFYLREIANKLIDRVF